MAWQKLTITGLGRDATRLADLLSESQALSVTLEDAADQPVFAVGVNDQPLWKSVNVCALFDSRMDLAPLIGILHTQIGQSEALTYQIKTVEDQDWVRLTRAQFKPQCFGKNLWICPAWCCAAELNGTVVRLDPGLAFGTGTHPTTALCLEWLAQHPPKNQRVIDYGCGSGILALAALALGAKKVYALDHDPQALESVKNNASLNDFVSDDNLEIFLDTACPAIKAQTVLANILANPLIQLAPTLHSLLDNKATLILSGILASEEKRLINAYQPICKHLNSTKQRGWVRVDLQKKSY